MKPYKNNLSTLVRDYRVPPWKAVKALDEAHRAFQRHDLIIYKAAEFLDKTFDEARRLPDFNVAVAVLMLGEEQYAPVLARDPGFEKKEQRRHVATRSSQEKAVAKYGKDAPNNPFADLAL